MSGIMSMVLGAKTAIAAAVDAYFNLVSLLLPGDGTNGAQNNTFLDSSTNNFTITRNGNTTQGTFSPFSQTGWGMYLNGSSYVQPSGSTTTLLGGALSTTSTFTIEGWFNVPGGILIAGDVAATSNNNCFAASLDASGYPTFGWWNGSAYTTRTGTAAAPLNTWNHVAWVVTGGNVYFFVNGVAAGSGAIGNSSGSPGTIVFGGYNNSFAAGWYSNLRICKAAVYTGAFTPSTSPLTTTSQGATNCTLLTFQNNRFLDNSSTAATFTLGGTPSVQAFSPFAPTAAYSAATNGGSGYFDASGDYLSISDASNLASPGSGDFTAQCWLYVPSLPNNLLGASAVYHLKNDTGTTTTVFIIEITSGGAMNLSTGTALIAGGTAGYVKAGAWNHLFVSRLSGTLRTFVNGTADISIANSTTYNGSVVQIGAWRYSTSDFSINGYIGGFRFQKGTGYSSVTIPTAPYTAITNTSLLLNFTNAGITDATAKNVLETVGNAQISTTQSKFGTTSMYFDGTGDYLVTPASPLYNLSTGNWTIEGWVYPTNNSGTNFVISWVGTSAADEIVIALIGGSSGNAYYLLNGSVVISGTGAPALNTWSHIALVKNGTTTTLYLNGTSTGTTTSVPTSSLKRVALGIGYSSLTSPYFGYIDDFRITQYARYTANFTPPTSAFPTQ